ncbi:hypothetical protein ACDX78_01640 [Virgibacillus oceani]
MKTHTCERCPEFTPAGTSNDFCIPDYCCPDKIEQPQLTSPTSCMPQEQLEELEENIAQVNQILLDLALSGKRDNNQIFQRAFDALVGKKVTIIINCPRLDGGRGSIERIGRVSLVGFDFVAIRDKEKQMIIIPFQKVHKIKLSGSYAEIVNENEEELENIDPCLRRKITFQFGKIVSSSPVLIQNFFRLRLVNYLLLLVDKKVGIRFEDEFINDHINHVNRENVSFCSNKNKSDNLINSICYIVVPNKKNKKRQP